MTKGHVAAPQWSGVTILPASVWNMCKRTIGVLQELGRSCRFLSEVPAGDRDPSPSISRYSRRISWIERKLSRCQGSAGVGHIDDATAITVNKFAASVREHECAMVVRDAGQCRGEHQSIGVAGLRGRWNRVIQQRERLLPTIRFGRDPCSSTAERKQLTGGDNRDGPSGIKFLHHRPVQQELRPRLPCGACGPRTRPRSPKLPGGVYVGDSDSPSAVRDEGNTPTSNCGHPVNSFSWNDAEDHRQSPERLNAAQNFGGVRLLPVGF
jgi:hypothetical protein